MLSTTLQKYEVKSGSRIHAGGKGQLKCEWIVSDLHLLILIMRYARTTELHEQYIGQLSQL